VFRSLRLNQGTGKYELGARGIAFGLDFFADRAGQLTEYNVLNMSLGATESADMASRITKLANMAVIVAAAGNEGQDLLAKAKVKFPAAYGGEQGTTGAYVISVGAAARDGSAMEKSNSSATKVDLFAVGDCQFSFRGEVADVVALGGTSQAAAWVSLTAALLFQMPLPGKHPSRIKSRIVATVRSEPQLFDMSESGGHLDPFRAIDVAVDHMRIQTADGSFKDVRALIDYGQSTQQLCAGANGAESVSRFERIDEKNTRFRAKQRAKDSVAAAEPTPWMTCGKVNADGLVYYYSDDAFERLAAGEKVQPEKVAVKDIKELIPRAFENIGDVATVPARFPFSTVLRETTRIMKSSGPKSE
jgi:hypothetical protein